MSVSNIALDVRLVQIMLIVVIRKVNKVYKHLDFFLGHSYETVFKEIQYTCKFEGRLKTNLIGPCNITTSCLCIMAVSHKPDK